MQFKKKNNNFRGVNWDLIDFWKLIKVNFLELINDLRDLE